MADRETVTRRPFPLGDLRWPWRITVVRAADRPHFIGLNRYPRQVIGCGIRLASDEAPGHPYLSILWARPSRWWQ